MTTETQTQSASLQLPNDQSIDLPVIVGPEDEHAVDIKKLRAQTGYITMDEGYGNSGSCQSAVTFIDGEKGILRYRGIPIEQLAEQSTFVEVCWLLMFGELPTSDELDHFSSLLTQNSFLHKNLRSAFEAFPNSAHPMARCPHGGIVEAAAIRADGRDRPGPADLLSEQGLPG